MGDGRLNRSIKMEQRINNVFIFDSMAELHHRMTYTDCHENDGHESHKAWFAGLSSREARNMLLTGDESRVAPAQALMDKMDLQIDTTGMGLGMSVTGFAPCVPEYLGGAPECMYSMQDCENTMAPLKVIAGISPSAEFSQSDVNKRGTVILAAVMALAVSRPVSLEVVAVMDVGCAYLSSNGDSFGAVRVAINSAPMDLASAAYALCNVGFARRVMFGMSQKLFASPLRWPSVKGVKMRDTTCANTITRSIELLGEDEANTLWIPDMHGEDPLTQNPTTWISKVLEKYGQPALA